MKPSYLDRFDALHHPDFLMAHLLGIEWLSVTEARREYFMSDVPRSYTYGSGVGARTYSSQPYTLAIEAVRGMLNRGGLSFNVCFLNRYDDQRNQLGWHADDSPEMDTQHPIAVLSLGAEREIWWKPKDQKGEVPRDQRQKLGHGSLFVMPAGFQEGHLHRIPKCDRACGVRISLTFRRYV